MRGIVSVYYFQLIKERTNKKTEAILAKMSVLSCAVFSKSFYYFSLRKTFGFKRELNEMFKVTVTDH